MALRTSLRGPNLIGPVTVSSQIIPGSGRCQHKMSGTLVSTHTTQHYRWSPLFLLSVTGALLQGEVRGIRVSTCHNSENRKHPLAGPSPCSPSPTTVPGVKVSSAGSLWSSLSLSWNTICEALVFSPDSFLVLLMPSYRERKWNLNKHWPRWRG